MPKKCMFKSLRDGLNVYHFLKNLIGGKKVSRFLSSTLKSHFEHPIFVRNSFLQLNTG